MRKNKNVLKAVYVLLSAVLSLLFIFLMFFISPKIDEIPETTGEVEYSVFNENNTYSKKNFTIGKDFTAIRIDDLLDVGRITKVNYIPDKYVHPSHFLDEPIQIVDLTKPFNFAEKGSLIFVIMNVDPNREDFLEVTEKLKQYKMGDNWQFTLSIPKIFCASNIYLKDKLISRNGEIKDYNFINFTDTYDKRTEEFEAKTKNTLIDLSFYTKRIALDNAYSAAQIITIHYQSTGSTFSAIREDPLIGTSDAVKSTLHNSQNLLISFTIVAIIIFFILLMLSILEQSTEFVSPIIWIFGIAILLLSRYFLSNITNIPLIWVAIWLCSTFIILAGALLSIVKNHKKFPLKNISVGIVVVAAILAFFIPFSSFETSQILKAICAIIKVIGSLLLFVYILLDIFTESTKIRTLKIICATFIAVSLLSSVFLPQIFPTKVNPMFWMCVFILVITFISVSLVFMETKKENVYLTNNLNLEVEQRVKEIRSIIAERDSLLQFVSHDMKKPLKSSLNLIEVAIHREQDEEQRKILQIIKQNNMRVTTNLSEIAGYSKFNYIAEQSQVTDLSMLCTDICNFHSFDCNANGIILNNLVDKKYNVFIKKQGLENAISSLILNAVEHANCKNITISAKADKNRIILSITDDGKGISNDTDIFKPYETEKSESSSGIGLYICKNIIKSMNGDLLYESSPLGTVFHIYLLKA